MPQSGEPNDISNNGMIPVEGVGGNLVYFLA